MNPKTCFHWDNNKQLRKRGFLIGGCVFNWAIHCGGKPELVMAPYRCPEHYITIEDIDKLRATLKK